jgi:hypothetical protein
MDIFHNTREGYAIASNDSSNTHAKEINGIIAMWTSVITQALMDASSNSKKKFAKKEKIQALKWLLDKKESKNFMRVCDLAELEYDDVIVKVKRALANGCKWRNDKKSNGPIA